LRLTFIESALNGQPLFGDVYKFVDVFVTIEASRHQKHQYPSLNADRIMQIYTFTDNNSYCNVTLAF